MKLDHIFYASDPDGIENTAERLSQILNITPKKTEINLTLGTKSIILPLNNEQYIEIIEALEHPSTNKIPFKEIIKNRSKAGGGWIYWAVEVEDITNCEKLPHKQSTINKKTTTNGNNINWLEISSTKNNPQLPFIVQWISKPAQNPNKIWNITTIAEIEISGDSQLLQNWLQHKTKETTNILEDPPIHWIAPKGQPGIMSVTFITEKGLINI